MWDSRVLLWKFKIEYLINNFLCCYMLKWSHFGYVALHKILKFHLFLLFNVATRKFETTHVKLCVWLAVIFCWTRWWETQASLLDQGCVLNCPFWIQRTSLSRIWMWIVLLNLLPLSHLLRIFLCLESRFFPWIILFSMSRNALSSPSGWRLGCSCDVQPC